MIIFSADPEPFRTENSIEMYKKMDTLPITPEITFIFHTDSFTEKNVNEWLPIIGHRLVIITDKYPKLSKNHDERIAIHDSLKKNNTNYSRRIEWLFGWNDRLRVSSRLADVPIPLIYSFVKINRPEIKLHRLFSMSNYTLNESRTRAILNYGIKADNSRMKWPEKKRVAEKTPSPFRSDDLYWEIITETQVGVANQVREVNKEKPSFLKKRKERENHWP